MNCINHPEQAQVAFCQQCGKPLCEACTRPVGNAVFCEPCLLARVNPAQQGYPYPTVAPQPLPPGTPSPFLAGLLGFIPGVGAMYNGQFVKAMMHILIFMLLIVISHRAHFAGILIAGWIFYQVFDAVYTARARVFGTPLPDPFGFNRFEGQVGFHVHVNTPYTPPAVPVSGVQPPYPAPYPVAQYPAQRPLPVGAFVLIGLGLLFLLGSMNIFNMRVSRLALPIFLIGLGVWLYLRKVNCGQRPLPGYGSGYFSYWSVRCLRGPAYIVLTGVLWLLDRLDIFSLSSSWPFYILLAGVLILVERLALNQAAFIPPAPTVPQTSDTSAESNSSTEANDEQEAPLTHRNPNNGE